MYRPRRTTELGEPPASSSKPRVSRIAQSMRRPSQANGERSTSMDRMSVHQNLQVPSATKRHRSSSVSRATTPQRTPQTNTKCPPTSEKHRAPVTDKKWMAENVQRIVDYLRDADIGLAKEFFTRGGLKAMSTKDFVAIMNHFLKSVVGNKPSIGNGKDYVEDVVKVLEMIEYPYTVAKSWLKTPSAPHSLTNVVLLFSWLLQFKLPPSAVSDFEANYVNQSEEFPDLESQLAMLRMPQEAFDLWNNKLDDEFDQMKAATIDKLVFKKTGLAGLDAVDKDIEKLNSKVQVLASERIVVKDKDKLQKLDKEWNSKKKQVESLEQKCHDLNSELRRLKLLVQTEYKTENDIKNTIEEMRRSISSQKATVAERNALIEEVDHLRHELDTKKMAVERLQQMGHKNQMELAKLLKQRTEVVAKFNNYVNELLTEIHELSIDKQLMYLDPNSDVDLSAQIRQVVPILEKIKNANCSQDEHLRRSMEENERKIRMITFELESMLQPRLLDRQKVRKDLQAKVEQLDMVTMKVKDDAVKQLERLASDLRELRMSNFQMSSMMAAKTADLTRERASSESMLQQISAKMEEVCAYREKRLQVLGGALDELRKNMDAFKLRWGDQQGEEV